MLIVTSQTKLKFTLFVCLQYVWEQSYATTFSGGSRNIRMGGGVAVEGMESRGCFEDPSGSINVKPWWGSKGRSP